MKNLILILALTVTSMVHAVTPSPTTTPVGTLTPTPNATQTPHVVIPDNAQGYTFAAAASMPLTGSYTVGTGVSTAMVVHVLLAQPFGMDYVKSISYGGVNLAHLITNRYLGGGNITMTAETWYLLVPPAGGNTFSVALNVTQPGNVGVAVSSYFNVWYLANMNGSNNVSNASITQNQFAGFNGGTTTGVFAQFNAATLTTQATGFTNRMLMYPGSTSYTLWMSIDDQRNYTPSGLAIPITWAYSGGTTTANALNYVELVPR